ncbi:MAG TPA: hypothetical protein VMW56_30775, partial [Candidatus Margulisiibacteriota bacterium]|nr:hypothetical protein [Candidatus Margulisiibacteriota bacterium]
MTANGHRWRSVVAPFLVLLATTTADAESAGSPSVGHTVIEDFKYIVDNAQLDLRDIVTSPLSITSEDSVFRSAHFYLAFAGVGALWGGSFALDHIMRNNLHHMSSSDADLL